MECPARRQAIRQAAVEKEKEGEVSSPLKASGLGLISGLSSSTLDSPVFVRSYSEHVAFQFESELRALSPHANWFDFSES